MASLAAHGTLIPRSPDGTVRGMALSVLAHAALLAALAYGVSWRSPAPETISAELWAAVPQTAAPPAAEPPAPPLAPAPTPAPTPKAEPVAKAAPPPPLPDPQIAIEKARKERLEKARLEREEQTRKDRLAREKLERDQAEREKADRERQRLAKEKDAAAQREKAADDSRQATIREDNLRRMMGQLGNTSSASSAQGSRGTAAVTAAPSASYGGRLIGAIKPNIVFTDTLAGNPAAVVEVRATASGTIVGRTLLKPSGVKEWDEAVLRAIDRTAKLPPDTDGRVPATLTITFRPRD